MKIQLQFENNDLEEMLTEFFRARGFEIKNLPELQEQFGLAFPGGLKVEAQTAEPPPAPAVKLSSTLAVTASEAPEAIAPVVSITARKEGNPRMTAADLFDPDLRGAPSRDELLAENQREIQDILAKSQQIEEKKRK
jgi:hypothetical protein